MIQKKTFVFAVGKHLKLLEFETLPPASNLLIKFAQLTLGGIKKKQNHPTYVVLAFDKKQQSELIYLVFHNAIALDAKLGKVLKNDKKYCFQFFIFSFFLEK